MMPTYTWYAHAKDNDGDWHRIHDSFYDERALKDYVGALRSKAELMAVRAFNSFSAPEFNLDTTELISIEVTGGD